MDGDSSLSVPALVKNDTLVEGTIILLNQRDLAQPVRFRSNSLRVKREHPVKKSADTAMVYLLLVSIGDIDIHLWINLMWHKDSFG